VSRRDHLVVIFGGVLVYALLVVLGTLIMAGWTGGQPEPEPAPVPTPAHPDGGHAAER